MSGSYWISARSAAKVVEQRVKQIGPGDTLKVESFKRDRWVQFTRNGDDTYSIVEHGFVSESTTVNSTDLRGEIRRLVDAEFPRSNQLRIHVSRSDESRA
ncbi:MAG: hypothetical protein QXN26_04970 [Thermoplasmataceae archaeon]